MDFEGVRRTPIVCGKVDNSSGLKTAKCCTRNLVVTPLRAKFSFLQIYYLFILIGYCCYCSPMQIPPAPAIPSTTTTTAATTTTTVAAPPPPTTTTQPNTTTGVRIFSEQQQASQSSTTGALGVGLAGQAQSITTRNANNKQEANNKTSVNQNQQQPKSLKFTLIAGKFWKFNIKANSFSSHREGELRLHKNLSRNNYIIDDDNWFQYNPQLQQLFAWPNLYTRPGTYQYVLLPSGLDIEADSENSISLEVAANIIVELIRPIYQGSSSDIDQLIDYKFSLDSLHRHSSYPLLLNQILSIFETIQPKAPKLSNHNPPTTTTLAPTTTALSIPLDSKLNSKSKFTEFLLISTNYSLEGDYFSLTWSTQPSLINNTLMQINNCRLPLISDVITRLSTLSSGYQSNEENEDQFVVYYPLRATQTTSQAIVSTERGNHLLKLELNGPCRKAKTLVDLGIRNLSLNKSHGNSSNQSVDSEDNDNSNKADENDRISSGSAASTSVAPSTLKQSLIQTRASSLLTAPQASPEAIETNRVPTLPVTTSSPLKINLTTITTEASPIATINSSSTAPITTTAYQTTSTPTTTTLASSTVLATTNGQKLRDFTTVESLSTSDYDSDPANNELNVVDKLNGTSTLEARINKQDEFKTLAAAAAASSIKTTTATPVVPQTQVPKFQPQAKSFEKFLDANDANLSQTSNSSILLLTPKLLPQPTLKMGDSIAEATTVPNKIVYPTPIEQSLKPNDLLVGGNKTPIIINPDAIMTINSVTSNNVSEISLNEDFMGILNDVMDYLVTIAVPASLIIGTILIVSIFIALCHLSMKRRKSKQFEVRNRFKFRYGSERRGFLKNSSKPVILEADRKSLSIGGGTPIRQQSNNTNSKAMNSSYNKDQITYLAMQQISSTKSDNNVVTANYTAQQKT